jgi:hypothetical protein
MGGIIMTKIKRLLAVVTASILTLGSISAIKADAVAVCIDDIDFYYTSGMWEEFDDHGHLDYAFQYGGTIDENGKVVYKLFRCNNGAFECVECPRQNYTQIEFSEEVTEDEWRSIYNKYSEELGYDEVRFFGCYFQGWHNRDENGEFTFQSDDIQDKRAVVKKMCSEMLKAGMINDVYYTKYDADVSTGCSTGGSGLLIKNYTGDVSELQAFFKEYDESFVVEKRENSDFYIVDIGVGIEDLRWEISDALEERFPDADAYTNLLCDYSGGDLTSGTFDILTAINEEDSCDTDQSGTVEITDATAILASYANTAAGIAAASAENPMDVNGDGAVGIDDATFVLTVYAELAAGLR